MRARFDFGFLYTDKHFCFQNPLGNVNFAQAQVLIFAVVVFLSFIANGLIVVDNEDDEENVKKKVKVFCKRLRQRTCASGGHKKLANGNRKSFRIFMINRNS